MLKVKVSLAYPGNGLHTLPKNGSRKVEEEERCVSWSPGSLEPRLHNLACFVLVFLFCVFAVEMLQSTLRLLVCICFKFWVSFGVEFLIKSCCFRRRHDGQPRRTTK
jgi:hypothetical protein